MRGFWSVILLTICGAMPFAVHAQRLSAPQRAKPQRVLHVPSKPAPRSATSQSQTSQVQQIAYTQNATLEACAEDCLPTSRSPVAWISAEYLFWSTKGVDTPSLVTTSPSGSNQDEAGILPSATTLFGGDSIHDEGRSGGRYTLGGWLNANQSKSFEVSYLELNDVSESFTASSSSFPILARPFFNTVVNSEDARLLSFGGLVEGDVSIRSGTEFQTYEFLLRHTSARPNGGKVGYVIGYRGANLEDSLRIDESTTTVSGLIAGSSFNLFDQFDTENEFHGITFGYEYVGPVIQNGTLELFGKVAIGGTSARAIVNGQTNVTAAAGDTSTSNAGLLVQDTNIGSFRDVDFDSLSEIGARLRFNVCQDLDFFLGYSFLLWGRVARAADQIDRGINVTQFPPGTLVGAERPRSPIQREAFWAQGLSLGFSYDF